MTREPERQDEPLNLEAWCLEELERHPDCGALADEPSLEDSVIIITQADHRKIAPKSADRELMRTPFPEDGAEGTGGSGAADNSPPGHEPPANPR